MVFDLQGLFLRDNVEPGGFPREGEAMESDGQTESITTSDLGPEERLDWELHRQLRKTGWIWAAASGTFLVALYVGVLTAANSLEHVIEDFRMLWYWMLPLVIGFAIQGGLFAYMRAAPTQHLTHGGRGVAASGSVTSLAMVACCAHHLTDVLPLVGLAGISLVLSGYQSLFLLLGVLSSVVGVTYMLGTLRRHVLAPPRNSLLAFVVDLRIDRFLPHVVGSSVLILAVAVALKLA